MFVIFHSQPREETRKEYELLPIPQTYIRPVLGGIKGYEIRFQIEPNGLIYVLRQDGAMPIEEFKQQPSDYPLHPLINKELELVE